jgi:hypothetical protein
MSAPLAGGRLVIVLPWKSPPLRSNNRLSRYPKAEKVKELRQAGKLIGRPLRRAHGQIPGPVRVLFVWTVTDRKARDVGASSPTLKAVLDGLRDAELLAEDHWRIVAEESCRIELGATPGCRIELHPDTHTPTDWSVTP